MGLAAYTSFEEPTTTGDPMMNYQDNPPPGSVQWYSTDHELVNNPGQNPVAYAMCSNGQDELGFQSYYLSTGGYGLTDGDQFGVCLLYTSPSPRDATLSRMPSSA